MAAVPLTSLQFLEKEGVCIFHPLQNCVDYIIAEYLSLIFFEEKANPTFQALVTCSLFIPPQKILVF